MSFGGGWGCFSATAGEPAFFANRCKIAWFFLNLNFHLLILSANGLGAILWRNSCSKFWLTGSPAFLSGDCSISALAINSSSWSEVGSMTRCCTAHWHAKAINQLKMIVDNVTIEMEMESAKRLCRHNISCGRLWKWIPTNSEFPFSDYLHH